MNTYLKYRPAWLQLVIFGSLTFGIFLATSFIAIYAISKIYHISPLAFQQMDLTKPDVVGAVKAFQAVSSVALFLVPSLVFAYLSDVKPLAYVGIKKPVPLAFFGIAIVVIFAAFPLVAWLS